MTIRFAAPHVLVLDERNNKDSVVAVIEVKGRVVNLHGDTVLVTVSNQRSTGIDNSRLVGREVSVPLDRATIVTRSEVDSWKFAYALLAGAVLIFAGLIISGG